jgi:two-component system CheB/CheR fusion protein
VNQKNKSSKKEMNRIKTNSIFPVVGIGASAGGLAAFKSLIKAIPKDSGMAFILVQHLDSTHESMLPEILQKVSAIPVEEFSKSSIIKPNQVYVMPSDKVIVTIDNSLQLAPRPEKKRNERFLPIDMLFTALAEIYESHAIGVVLSGSASDGTKGLRTIKDNGGITFAQSLDSADQSSMPGSAINAGVVDFILPPDKIPQKLLDITQIINSSAALVETPMMDDDDVYRQIITLLRVRKGTDFTYYKETTIRRRILRRMAINKIKNVTDYLAFLRKNKGELDILFQDFLIPVTSFFRDHEIFESLSNKYLPELLKSIPSGKTIRVWVAGCSIGAEAYSLAILFKELLETNPKTNHDKKVQIFASDLSEIAIETARHGVYSEVEITGISDERLKKNFVKKNGRYQINRQIRDMCVFAYHDFLKDPPFGKMDMISCRNVLIYFEPYLQKKALTTFHYVLNPDGLLLLGKSETTAGVPNLYFEVAKKDKIFSRKNVPSKFVQVVKQRSELDFNQIEVVETPEKKSPDFERTADEIMLKKYTPAGVVVNDAMDIVQFRGKTSPFLEQTSGKPSHNLMVLAVHGLAFELRNILHKAKQDNIVVKKENIPIKINDELHSITIEAIPLPNTIEAYFLVLFHDTVQKFDVKHPKTGKTKKDQTLDNKRDDRIQQLEQELVDTREDMRSITEDQEVSIEELQSANEELMSGSEELQSLNEELETSKEELQSTNEELIVLNQEMSSLNEQIESERNYSESIVANIREPLLVMDKHLRIKTANNAFLKQFRISEKDIEGLLIFDISNKSWDFSELRTLLEDLIPKSPVVVDYEIVHDFPKIGELFLLLNARKVLNEVNSENLILLSLEDITQQVKEREKREQIQERYTKELEEKIEERTSELQQVVKELSETNIELVHINKELEAFTYISSHDLQEPLRKIQTFAGRILEKENQNLSEKGKMYFTIMQTAAKRMQNLIEDLLAFSRLASIERTFETVNIKTICDEVKTNLNEIIEEKQATVEIGEMCEASIIVFQFRQMMHNLLSNALKFTKPNIKPHIKISGSLVKGKVLKFKDFIPDRNYCHISVSDNGIGFEEKFSEKIFGVFQKLHGKEEYPGTGIGLATVKKIVGQHSGVIKVKSVLNKGTTFDIYFPVNNHSQYDN